MFNTTDDTRIKKQSLRRSTLTSQSFWGKRLVFPGDMKNCNVKILLQGQHS